MSGYLPYEKLDVFQEAFQLALHVHKITLAWPKHEQYGGIADQLRRSSKSICANLVEGLGRRASTLDKKRFVQISLGSVEESRLWILFAQELGYMHINDADKIRAQYTSIARMLYTTT